MHGRYKLIKDTADQADRIWVAYEPVWSIGESGIPASAEYAEEMHIVMVDSFFAHLDLGEEKREQMRKHALNSVQHCHRAVQVTELLSQVFQECIGSTKEALESQLIKPVRMAQKYVEQHYQEKILLEDVADVVGLNPVYFSALFKKETNLNFSSYLINFRMERAKELLTTTNDTISAIAAEVGYPEQKYFSQQFKKVVGVKPVIFRQLHS